MTHNDLLLEIVCYKELTNSVYIWHKVLGMFQITGYAKQCSVYSFCWKEKQLV
jgi:hypothetical protein